MSNCKQCKVCEDIKTIYEDILDELNEYEVDGIEVISVEDGCSRGFIIDTPRCTFKYMIEHKPFNELTFIEYVYYGKECASITELSYLEFYEDIFGIINVLL